MSSLPSLELLSSLNERFHPFCELAESIGSESSFHFSAKDNLCAVGFQARAGSRILEGYRPPFDATAVQRLKAAGGALLGKTNMDEFGFGTFSTNSGFQVPLNPFDPERACGGSSGGAAVATSLLEGHVALGVSTGGSISSPASLCGVIGLAPTYGRVSRHGLIDYANSLDKVGLLVRNASDLRKYLPIISGPDPKDPTSCAQPPLDLGDESIDSVGVPKESLKNLSPAVGKGFDSALDSLRESGIEVKTVDMPELRFAMPAYYILATSEASTNLARYCGMRFGARATDYSIHFNDMFSQIRSEHFGEEAKRRILLGTYARMVGFRDRYYLKALSVRQSVIAAYGKAFEESYLLLTPTMPIVAPRFSEIEAMRPLEIYQMDFLTVPPNLAGLPHLSVPCSYEHDLPVGMQFVAPHWMERRLLAMADEWTSRFELKFPEVQE